MGNRGKIYYYYITVNNGSHPSSHETEAQSCLLGVGWGVGVIPLPAVGFGLAPSSGLSVPPTPKYTSESYLPVLGAVTLFANGV